MYCWLGLDLDYSSRISQHRRRLARGVCGMPLLSQVRRMLIGACNRCWTRFNNRYDELAEFLQRRIKVELQYGKDLAVLGKQVKQCSDTGYVPPACVVCALCAVCCAFCSLCALSLCGLCGPCAQTLTPPPWHLRVVSQIRRDKAGSEKG